MRKATIITALLLLAPAISQAKSLEDLLVEKGVISKGEAMSAAGAGSSKVYWNGGSKIDFPDTGFTVGINTFLQTRYEFTDNDDGVANTSSFSVPKARISVSGTAVNEEFSYKLEGDFVGGSDADGERSAILKDGYLTWHACDWVDVKMGAFKVGYGRQFQNSDSALQFADRSAVSDYFTLGRQNGAMATTKFADDTLWLSAGIYNGTSDGEGTNRSGNDTKHTGTVSARWNPMGKMNAFNEGDLDWSDDMAVSVGATYLFSDAKNDLGAGVEDTNSSAIAVDANMLYQGWSLHAELFNNSSDSDDSDYESEPTGFYAQAGYFIDPKTVELAARYGFIDCDDGKAAGVCEGNDNVNEVTAGVNYFWWKNHMKASFNYVLENQDGAGAGGDDVNTNRWVFQLSSYF